MPFDWRELLIVAHELRNDSREGAQRTCVGRSYYYVYNLGLKKARKMRFTGQMPGLHKQLWNWCQKQADRDIKTMGTIGSRMHSRRIDADYSDPVPNLANAVERQLNAARDFEVLVASNDGQAPPAAL